MRRRVSVLGVTGSIGRNTASLLAADAAGHEVVAVTAHRDVPGLAAAARRLRAELAVIADPQLHGALAEALAGSGIATAAGPAAVVEAAARPADWVMNAIVGAAGLEPSLAALESGATLALANKESMVAAGALMRATARRHGGRILPVDSEHSGLFQALGEADIASVERLVITASGGAFRDWPAERLATATPEEAARHPNWDMGTRITIDSASLFNKALEMIEAHELFGIAPDRIEVVIHPESIIHALVGFVDGALIAHLGAPDMRHAIGHALYWPERRPLPVARVDLAALGQLTFRPPDPDRHPALRLAREVLERGGLAGAAFNAAKEAALDAFLARRIGFLDMARVVERVLEAMVAENRLAEDIMSLDNVRAVDREARRRVAALAGS